MSEYNNNDPLEELFQRKAEEYDISYREEDWNDLDEQLDALDAKYAALKRRWLAAAVALIAFSVLGYFTYQNYQQINSLNNQISQTEETTPPPSETENEDLENLESQQADPQEPDKEELAESYNDGNDSQGVTPAPANETQATATNEEKEQSAQTTFVNAGKLAVSQIDCRQCELSSLATLNPVDWKMIQTASGQHTGRKLAAVPRSEEPVSSQSLHTKATVGLVMGPDLSTVGSVSNFYDPGYKIGVTMNYNLSDRWGISIGAIRANVKYKASGGAYNPPEGYWNYGIQASETTGQCILIDVPVSVNYRFLHFNHSRMYATAGFSSYIMLNEDYRFSYDSYQHNQPQQWNEDTGTTHFISNASFSVGYELDIAPNLSLRAEPFVKVPMKEVGWMNVNLYSVGTLFSLNYHFK